MADVLPLLLSAADPHKILPVPGVRLRLMEVDAEQLRHRQPDAVLLPCDLEALPGCGDNLQAEALAKAQGGLKRLPEPSAAEVQALRQLVHQPSSSVGRLAPNSRLSTL